jgi:hypothetical protein
MLKGITKSSKFICFKFLDSLPGQYYYISGVYPPGAYKCTFSAKHAFVDLLLDSGCLPALDQYIDFSQAQMGKIARGTGTGATTTLHTVTETGFTGINIFRYPLVVGLIIDVPVFKQNIPKIAHNLFYFFLLK